MRCLMYWICFLKIGNDNSNKLCFIQMKKQCISRRQGLNRSNEKLEWRCADVIKKKGTHPLDFPLYHSHKRDVNILVKLLKQLNLFKWNNANKFLICTQLVVRSYQDTGCKLLFYNTLRNQFQGQAYNV